MTKIFNHQRPPVTPQPRNMRWKARAPSLRQRLGLRSLMLWLCVLLPSSIVLVLQPPAYGLQLEVGVGTVEEGDNRMRPGLVLNAGSKDYQVHMLYFFRHYEPVSDSTMAVNLLRTFPLPYYRTLEAAVGLALLAEQTTLNYPKEADQAYNYSQTQYNAGFATGLYWLQSFSGAWQLRLGWESTIFPAGLLGGIFLVSGRKQYLSISTGVSL